MACESRSRTTAGTRELTRVRHVCPEEHLNGKQRYGVELRDVLLPQISDVERCQVGDSLPSPAIFSWAFRAGVAGASS